MPAASRGAGSFTLHIVFSARSSVRQVVTLVLFATLLFSRLAFAFYACPASQSPGMGTVQMIGTSCTQLVDHSKMVDDMQPALCAQHCANEPQITSDAIEPPTNAPVLLLAYPTASHLLSLAAVEPAWLRLAVADTPHGPGGSGDALFLQTRRLRI